MEEIRESEIKTESSGEGETGRGNNYKPKRLTSMLYVCVCREKVSG